MASIKNSKLEYQQLRLGIVCPMANERENAEAFVNEVIGICRSFNFKSVRFFAVLDNVSKDGTRDILESLGRRIEGLAVVFAPENRNVVDAYKRGYREALKNDCDWILEIDAGYSHNPTDIPQFFNLMITGEYDCVFGNRFHRESKIKDMPFARYLVSRGGTLLTNLMLGTRLPDMTSGFELFRKDALAQILEKGIFSIGPFFQTEIKSYAHGLRIADVPIFYNAGTPHLHSKALSDSLGNLWHLFVMRCKKQLFIVPSQNRDQ
jgi:dolichol-phosphate mannosyltransferase